jgi:hypothetical protein
VIFGAAIASLTPMIAGECRTDRGTRQARPAIGATMAWLAAARWTPAAAVKIASASGL